MWNTLTSNTSLRVTCIMAILSWLTWLVSWLGVTGLGAAAQTHVLPEPLFVVLFAPISLVFMVSGLVMLVLHGFVLTLAASLMCLGISTRRVLLGTATWSMVALAATAVAGHISFLLFPTP